MLENALYLALNTPEESATISERMAARLHGPGNNHAVARFEVRAREARRRAAEIRRILTET